MEQHQLKLSGRGMSISVLAIASWCLKRVLKPGGAIFLDGAFLVVVVIKFFVDILFDFLQLYNICNTKHKCRVEKAEYNSVECNHQCIKSHQIDLVSDQIATEPHRKLNHSVHTTNVNENYTQSKKQGELME